MKNIISKNNIQYQSIETDFENLSTKIFDLKLFDPAWYSSVYSVKIPDLSYFGTIEEKLLRHYLCEGWKDGFDPCKNFSTSNYLADYCHVKSAGICPLVH